jgi:outer membrane protein assembly factor BamB
MTQMQKNLDLLYAATSGHVIAVDPISGQELWRQKLPKARSVMTMLLKGDFLYVGSGGYVYCLDRYLGEIRWRSDLKRLGFDCVMLTMEGAVDAGLGASLAAAQAAAVQAAAAAAG